MMRNSVVQHPRLKNNIRPMSRIAENLCRIRAEVPQGVELVAVSKFHPVEALSEAYDAGQRVFGESRVNELVAKAATLPGDIRWHFIGHLQTNKVRAVIPHVDLIHSIDSERLLRLVDSEARRIGRRVKVLLQLHVAKEETKFGFTPDELLELVTPELVDSLPGIEIVGVMGMASNVDDDERISQDFAEIKNTFDALAAGPMAGRESFREISMGMSHDWPLAVTHGSTMVRIGTAIFGEREY